MWKSHLFEIVNLLIGNLEKNREEFRKLLDLDSSKPDVLDFGCGTGLLCTIFDKDHYTGYDRDRKRLEFASKKHPGYRFLSELDSGAKYDVILIVGVFHHIPPTKTAQVVEDLNKMCKPDTKIVIVEPTLARNRVKRFIIKSMDRGKYILSKEDYSRLFESRFAIELNRELEFKGINKILSNDELFILRLKSFKSPAGENNLSRQ